MMKINQVLASMVAASALMATFASADVYTWTGTVDNDWTKEGNWDLGSGTPGANDAALFDTTGSQAFTATNMSSGNIGTFVKLKGDGQVTFDNAGPKIQTDYGFEAVDSVSLTLTGGAHFYPWTGPNSNVWASSGTFDTDQSESYGLLYNNPGAVFRQMDGTILINGYAMLNRSSCHYYLDGGELKSANIMGRDWNKDGSAVDLRGGDLTQSGNIDWGGHSDINIESGTFTVEGKISAFNTSDGKLNFASDSTGSFVSTNSLTEIQGFISATNITIGGAVATENDFDINTNAGTTTVMIPEPATLSLMGIFGLFYLLRRKLNS